MTKEEILQRLIELNYFKFVPQNEYEMALANARKDLERNLLSNDLDLYEEKKILCSRDRRHWGSDGEDLAEGGIEEKLKLMAEVLTKEGVTLQEISQEIGQGNGYAVTVNGKNYRIYEETDINGGEIWNLALVGLMTIANDLLASAGSQERLYATHAGNDGFVFFLTEEQYNFLMENGINTSDYSVCPRPLEEVKKQPL